MLNYAIKQTQSGDLRIVFRDLDVSFTGASLCKNNQNLIILNSRYSLEYNLKKLLHELYHIRYGSGEENAIAYENSVKELNSLAEFLIYHKQNIWWN